MRGTPCQEEKRRGSEEKKEDGCCRRRSRGEEGGKRKERMGVVVKVHEATFLQTKEKAIETVKAACRS